MDFPRLKSSSKNTPKKTNRNLLIHKMNNMSSPQFSPLDSDDPEPSGYILSPRTDIHDAFIAYLDRLSEYIQYASECKRSNSVPRSIVLERVPEYIRFVECIASYFPQDFIPYEEGNRIVRPESHLPSVFSVYQLEDIYTRLNAGETHQMILREFLFPLQNRYPQLFYASSVAPETEPIRKKVSSFVSSLFSF